MFNALWNRLVAAVIVCSLLFQSCQSGMRAITEEEPVLKEERLTPADHVQDAGEALSSGALVLAPARAGARVSGVSSSELVSAVVPPSPPFFAGPFTASSGERVLLRQQQGQWQAVLQGGVGAVVHGRTLPVVNSGDIGTLLSSLQGQDVWSSRSRIHVLAAPTPPNSPCVYVGQLGLLGGAPEAGSGASASSLLARKLEDPECVLSESESIELLTFCVAQGVENAKKVKDKEAVIVIGNTGAGKSTFVNYLLGCRLVEKTEKLSDDEFEDAVIVVQPVSEGGPRDEVMLIGHEESKTYMPQVALAPDASSWFYCDCPGFLDNRGAEINISNAVNIKHVLQSAKCVKVVILVDYRTIDATRGHGLKETMKLCTQLFGSDATPESFQDSVLLGVTRAPEHMTLGHLRQLLLKQDKSPMTQALSKHVFLYDPLNRGGAHICSRDQCVSKIASLRGIPQAQSLSMFQTVLTAEDELELIDIVERQSETLVGKLNREAYVEANSCWQLLQHLKVVDDHRVDILLRSVQLRLQEFASKRTNLFKDCLLREDLKEAESHLSSLRSMGKAFDAKEDLALDLDKLKDSYDAKQQSRELKENLDREAYNEAGSCWKALQNMSTDDNVHVEESLKSSQGHLREFASKRANLFTECLLHEDIEGAESHLSSLRAMSEVFYAKRDLGLDLGKLEYGYDVLFQKEQGKLLQAQLTAQAFGAKAWSQYFGDVGAEPSLPTDISTTLSGACPFWPDKQVKDTHLLVLIPATVNGKPYNLNLLEEFIQHPLGGGHATKYDPYGDLLKKAYGTQAPRRSYWVLMTRDVLEGSRNKTYADQQALVAGHAKRTQLPYELPSALEAATAILSHYVRSGERLCADNPWTYTRCREFQKGNFAWTNPDDGRVHSFNIWYAVVGGFSSGGLDVYDDRDGDGNDVGVVGFRKF